MKYKTKKYLGWILIDFIVILLLLYISINTNILALPLFSSENNGSAKVLLGIAAILAVVWRLRKSALTSRSDYVRNYLSKFFLNDELNDSFYSLVQEYDRLTWEKVCAELSDYNQSISNKKNKSSHSKKNKGAWKKLNAINKNRKSGTRYYHPAYFQGSEEERRLDRLLGYFDIIAFHVQNNDFPIEDVESLLGYQINAIGSSQPIKHYMEIIEDNWKDNAVYRRRFGNTIPYYHLRQLIHDIHDRRRKAENRMHKLLKT